MFQKIIIVGNLGRDPEIKYMPDGKAVCNYSVAVKDGENTIWFDVASWGKSGENDKLYLKKGSQVLVEGTVKPSAWIDKKTGEAKCKLTLNSFRTTYLSKKGETSESTTTIKEEDESPF